MYRASRGGLAFLLLGMVSITCVGQQNSSLRVTVKNSQGNSLSFAAVHIVGIDRVGLPAPNGTILFKDIPPGSYSLIATRPEFRDKVVNGVVLAGGKTTELTIAMEQAPPKASDYKMSQDLASPSFYSKVLTEINQPSLCPDSVSDGR
jgi:hypothetical protein